MRSSSEIKPIEAIDRIVYLDVLRGMAILFIFIANVYTFSGWYALSDEVKNGMSAAPLNEVIKQFTVVFIDGKWYSLFSILFGIGFVIQYENAKQKGKSFALFFSKRMLGLLLFGSLHLFFLWLGDILALYALLGFVLILFRNHSNKSLLIWALVLLLLPIVHLLGMMLFDNFYPSSLFGKFATYLSDNNVSIKADTGQSPGEALAFNWLDNTSWKEFFIFNFGMPFIRLALILIEGRVFKVLACFLIGIWAGRQMIHHQLLQNKALLKKIAIGGLTLGIPMNILMAFSKLQSGDTWEIIQYSSYAFGVVPLACAYAALLALALNFGHQYLLKLAPVGQMALSNYLFHTLISILIFYGVGFGLALETPLWLVMLIAVFIFTCQIVFSKYWLQYFKYGPLEWLWRMMTYSKYIKNKK